MAFLIAATCFGSLAFLAYAIFLTWGKLIGEGLLVASLLVALVGGAYFFPMAACAAGVVVGLAGLLRN